MHRFVEEKVYGFIFDLPQPEWKKFQDNISPQKD
jgi:hypothetical protein